MAVNTDVHKVVVMLDGQDYGFTKLSTAIAFVEEQKLAVNGDYSKTYADIESAINAGTNESTDLRIMDADVYADSFMDEEEDSE